MVQKDDDSSKKGSPPVADSNHPSKTTTDTTNATSSSSSSSNPQPSHPPPPPAHHAAHHHHYYAYGHPPPGYDHMPPPPSERAPPPGPYTTAQYDSIHGTGGSRNNNGMVPPPPYHRTASGSPPSHIPHHGRDPPPHPHYPPMSEHPGHHPAAGYWDEHHRAAHHHHWAAHHHHHHPEGGYGPPPYYETSQPYPPPPPPSTAQPYHPAAAPPQPHAAEHTPTLGPYRFSDHTLQREAINRLSNMDPFEDDREGATSPTQIETSHREEVTTMGCTCKKTKCLKLYCQCFAVKIYCGGNCRCMTCRNTAQFESERKDAIRNILSRNPGAFDTKFKKEDEQKEIPQDRVLAHKLGCKCRKSACMKKYCECYAGGVKCSPSCRCVGCKNVPRDGMGPPSPDGAAVYTREESPESCSSDGEGSSRSHKKREPWMMNAAQNLAFLKHASPMAEKPKRTQSTDTGDVGSMPSLGSEESPPSGDGGMVQTGTKANMKTISVAGASSSISEPTTSEKTAVNALLMAAMAMADMAGQEATTTTDNNEQAVSTPPKKEGDENSTKAHEDGDRFVTPQKNLLSVFSKSPKRKQSQQSSVPSGVANPQDTTVTQPHNSAVFRRRDSNSSPSSDGDDDSPKRDHPGETETPSNAQKIKRSRIGSLKKGPPRNLGNDMSCDNEGGKYSSKGATNVSSYNTPQTKGKSQTNELTPVSARCIDFKKITIDI